MLSHINETKRIIKRDKRRKEEKTWNEHASNTPTKSGLRICGTIARSLSLSLSNTDGKIYIR